MGLQAAERRRWSADYPFWYAQGRTFCSTRRSSLSIVLPYAHESALATFANAPERMRTWARAGAVRAQLTTAAPAPRSIPPSSPSSGASARRRMGKFSRPRGAAGSSGCWCWYWRGCFAFTALGGSTFGCVYSSKAKLGKDSLPAPVPMFSQASTSTPSSSCDQSSLLPLPSTVCGESPWFWNSPAIVAHKQKTGLGDHLGSAAAPAADQQTSSSTRT
jgi:hypothetical protein